MEARVIEGFELAAEQLNAMTPVMVDEETRMEKATVGPGALMTYHYIFPNFASKDIDVNMMSASVFPIIRDGVCARHRNEAFPSVWWQVCLLILWK